ncbi:MAG: tetratricopeptide repeat protein [Candidatus Marinimicrobia bacterium]|nr:tetratricopeptide repeat protein [Candidatus Neomarinimicrobiota bacterium]
MESLYIAIIVLAGLGVLSLILYFALRDREPRRTTESLYSDGLRLLLDGQLEPAAAKLKQVVRRDTNQIDAYVKLGDIFRKNGQHTQALKIHQTLTVRRNLTQGQQIDIYYSLVQDYKAIKQYDKALDTADKLLQIDKKHIKGLKAKMQIYRILDRWEEAGEMLKSIQKYTGTKDNALLALYKVEEGRSLEAEGEKKEGRIRYRKALKLYPESCAALYYLGNSYDDEGRTEEAVENWKQFGETCPELLHLVSDAIEQRSFDLGNFNEVEEYYQKLVSKYPENIEAAASIAGIYEKKGQLQDAINSIENALHNAPDSLRAHTLLAKFYNRENSSNKKVDEELDSILASIVKNKTFQCKECGNTTSDVQWICHECYTPYAFFSYEK